MKLDFPRFDILELGKHKNHESSVQEHPRKLKFGENNMRFAKSVMIRFSRIWLVRFELFKMLWLKNVESYHAFLKECYDTIFSDLAASI